MKCFLVQVPPALLGILLLFFNGDSTFNLHHHHDHPDDHNKDQLSQGDPVPAAPQLHPLLHHPPFQGDSCPSTTCRGLPSTSGLVYLCSQCADSQLPSALRPSANLKRLPPPQGSPPPPPSSPPARSPPLLFLCHKASSLG